MATELLYHRDSSLNEAEVLVLATGMDELGPFFIPDRTIFYFGGGGQPADSGFVRDPEGNMVPILKAIPAPGGIAHYLASPHFAPGPGVALRMSIDPARRLLHSRIHTAGHLVGSMIFEQLRWKLVPLKGYHYPDSPYVEFSNPEQLHELDSIPVEEGMREWIRSDRAVFTSTDGSLDGDREKTFVPEGFSLEGGRSLRWVGIDGFKYYPCAGTHVPTLGLLGKVSIKYFKGKKGNMRVAYQVEE